MNGGDGRDDRVWITNASSAINRESKLQFEGFRPGGKERPQMLESLSTEWTDEKHNLYLNFIEAAFVKQLNNQDNHLRDLHVRLYRKQKCKVLQRGCWEKPNFERTQTQLNNGNQSSHLLENQFIQHSSPASAVKGLEVTARDIPQHGKLVSEVVHFQGQKYRREVFGLAKRLKQLSSCYSAICQQDSISSNTEVSDQNFVEEDFERKPLISSCKKRPRAAAADVSIKDQVVPLGIFPFTASANRSYSQMKAGEHCRDLQPENTTIPPLPKYNHPSEDR